ncbi:MULTISPECIES: RidA family protein [unclassified Streptomyces]|uniref:RidA family protein n=1 Tax=unclassified Streptomyces TaxID=2593676 RepID=UPI002E35D2D1|nr:RidA family protein [Streptomyces sp. NBC_01361]
MSKKIIQNGSSIGPYSQAVVVGNHCYVAGTGGFVPGTSQLVEGGREAEIRQTMKNLEAVINEAGYRMSDIVTVTTYLRDIADWPAFNDIYSSYFEPESAPARAVVGVADLPAGANVEVTCVAVHEDAA